MPVIWVSVPGRDPGLRGRNISPQVSCGQTTPPQVVPRAPCSNPLFYNPSESSELFRTTMRLTTLAKYSTGERRRALLRRAAFLLCWSRGRRQPLRH